MDPLISWTLSLAFAALLLLGAAHKALAFASFRAVLAAYELLPRVAVPLMAVTICLAEAGLGIAWLLAPTKSGVAMATAGLLTLYAGALAINLLRGRREISCGCGFAGAGEDPQRLSWWLVTRNLALAGLAALAGQPSLDRSLAWGDHIQVLAGLVLAMLLFAAINQLIRNQAMMQNRTKGAAPHV